MTKEDFMKLGVEEEIAQKCEEAVADLQKQLAVLQADNKAKDTKHAAEIKQIKVNAAVEAALASSKARNAKAVKALLTDLDTAELCEDGSIKGLHEQLEALRKAEDSSFLFESAKGSSTKPVIKGATPGQTGREEPDSKVDISKMNYEELTAYMEANPTL